VKRRRVAVWFISAPLMLAGTQVAHVFAYRLVYPNAQVRLAALLATGHGYMVGGASGYAGYLPLVLGLGGALELVAFGCVVAAKLRGRAGGQVPPWAFALLPLLGFCLQEFTERWLSGASFPWWMVLQPTFRVGLLLQLPFALVVFLLAGLLLRVADRVARRLAGHPLPRGLPVELGGWIARAVWPPRPAALAAGHAGRAPPFRTVPATAALRF
jgi:hypothetical protein